VAANEVGVVALLEIDRSLLERCLASQPDAWAEFVDRFMGLVIHVTNHTAKARSIRLADQDREDLVAEVFLAILKDNLALLRHFRGQCSLATYLAVIARRIVVREILGRKNLSRLMPTDAVDGQASVEQRISDRDEVQRLLQLLDGDQAKVVQMFHLEGKSYHDIAAATGLPENTIGSLLSRAREKLRFAAGAS
jgi:RNA polymerase sigma-70 factor (ECF subfamily)